ncbi:hypothetical protein SOVF_201170, partial [Spinacia oleracea]
HQTNPASTPYSSVVLARPWIEAKLPSNGYLLFSIAPTKT